MNKSRWILVGIALFSAMWLCVASSVVRRFGDAEVAGWVPFWQIPVSLLELVLWVLAMCWPRRVTVMLVVVVAVAQFLVGCGLFPK